MVQWSKLTMSYFNSIILGVATSLSQQDLLRARCPSVSTVHLPQTSQSRCVSRTVLRPWPSLARPPVTSGSLPPWHSSTARPNVQPWWRSQWPDTRIQAMAVGCNDERIVEGRVPGKRSCKYYINVSMVDGFVSLEGHGLNRRRARSTYRPTSHWLLWYKRMLFESFSHVSGSCINMLSCFDIPVNIKPIISFFIALNCNSLVLFRISQAFIIMFL